MNKKNLGALLTMIFSFSIILSACGETTEQSQTSMEKVPENVALASDLEGVDYSKSYAEVLDKYRAFANDYNAGNVSTNNNYDDQPWSDMSSTSVKPEGFGYALKDLSGNGTPELILLTKSQYFSSDYFINAIYSLVGNEPKLLDSFRYRYNCSIGKDGFIYIHGSGTAWDSEYEKCKIKSDGSAIEIIEKFESDSYDEKTQERIKDSSGEFIVKYYKSKGNEKRSEISKQEFDEFYIQWPTSYNECGLEFIPLMEVQNSSASSEVKSNIIPSEMRFDIVDENRPIYEKDQIDELNNILKNSGKWTQLKDEDLPESDNIGITYTIEASIDGLVTQDGLLDEKILKINLMGGDTFIKVAGVDYSAKYSEREVNPVYFRAPKALFENIQKFLKKVRS